MRSCEFLVFQCSEVGAETNALSFVRYDGFYSLDHYNSLLRSIRVIICWFPLQQQIHTTIQVNLFPFWAILLQCSCLVRLGIGILVWNATRSFPDRKQVESFNFSTWFLMIYLIYCFAILNKFSQGSASKTRICYGGAIRIYRIMVGLHVCLHRLFRDVRAKSLFLHFTEAHHENLECSSVATWCKF